MFISPLRCSLGISLALILILNALVIREMKTKIKFTNHLTRVYYDKNSAYIHSFFSIYG
jgi:hypothetical protein